MCGTRAHEPDRKGCWSKDIHLHSQGCLAHAPYSMHRPSLPPHARTWFSACSGLDCFGSQMVVQMWRVAQLL